MFSPPPLLETLLSAPELPEILQQAQSAWAEEQMRRRKFLNDITPEHKWEFINGEVIMHSPALQRHLVATGNLYQMLFVFVKNQQCGNVFVEKAMTSFPRNDYEPDVIFFGPAKAALIHPETLRFPVPDLIIEVLSPSTEARDRGVKFRDYALHGVSEYWLVDPVTASVELHQLDPESQTYRPAKRRSRGYLESAVLVGLRIPVTAIFDEDATMAVLREMNVDEVALLSLRTALQDEAQRREFAEKSLKTTTQTLQTTTQTLETTTQTLKTTTQSLETTTHALEVAERAINALKRRLEQSGSKPSPKKFAK